MARHCTSLLVGLFLLGAGCGDQKDADESQEEEEANPWVDADGGLNSWHVTLHCFGTAFDCAQQRGLARSAVPKN